MTLTNQEYHAKKGVSSTSLKRILRSPAHYLHELKHPTPPTAAMQFGTAFHSALLEPESFAKDFVLAPEFSGTGSRAKKEDWLLRNAGKHILSSDAKLEILQMLDQVRSHPLTHDLLTQGKAEQSYFDTCPETGLIRKARPDFIRSDGLIVDIKTTTDASPQNFPRAVHNFQYSLSAAYYLDVVGSALGRDLNNFVIIAVEKDPPYAVAVYKLNSEAIAYGRVMYRHALRILQECERSGRFPSYPEEMLDLTLPAWAFKGE